jgi:hypothetical protein
MAYSNDDDLRRYCQTVDIDGPFTEYHNMAQDEVQRRLRRAGWTATEITGLSAQSKADLVEACCYYVLYKVYEMVNEEEAERYREKWEHAYGRTTLEVDVDGDTVAERAEIHGGYRVMG